MHIPPRSPRRPADRPIALALRLIFGGLCVAGAALPAAVSAQAQAEAPAQAPVLHRFAIPAGPLAAALNQAGEAAGVLLSFDPALVADLRSPGLQGRYGLEEGLQRLLAGSGLTAQARGDGSYVLRKSPDAPAVALLPSVRVLGATEGTGSYTTNLTNTATKLDLSLRETPQSITVVTHKRMADQGLDEISKVLDQAPGLYFHNTNTVGGDNNFIYSRGFELQNYQVDGMPRSTRFGFKNDIADTSVFDRVEIVRGASGLLNGVGEPSGAINLVRKLPTRAFQAHAAAKYGSWNYYRAEADVSGALNETGSVRGRVVGAYQDNDTFTDRVNMKKKIAYGIVEADLTAATILSAGIEYQHHETSGAGGAFAGAPLFFADGTRTHFSRSTNLAAKWGHTRRENLTLFSALEHYFDNDWRVRLDLEHARREYDIAMPGLTWDLRADGTGTFRATRYLGKPEQSSVGLHATGPYSLFGRTHELVVGGSYYRMEEQGQNTKRHDAPITNAFEFIRTGEYPVQDLGPNGSGQRIHDVQRGFYAATRLKPFDGVAVIVGGRLSTWQTRTDRYTADGVATRGQTRKESSVVTPYAGIVVDLTDYLSVYGSYTDIFQPATSYDADGNLLDPAEGTNVEGGVKLAFFEDRLNLSASYYRTKKDNVPEYVPGPGGTVNYGPTGQYVYRGIDGTKTTGFEFEVAGQLSADWQVSGGYSYSKPKDADGNARLTYLPTRTFKLFTSYRPARLLPGLTLGANLRWQNRIYTGRYEQDSLALVDVMAQYAFTPRLSATLNVNNVFDKAYYTDINISGWYGEPRSAFLNLRYAF